MDPMDILGGLLGQKSSGGGLGGKILKDILGGGAGRTAPAQPRPPQRTPPSAPASRSTTSSGVSPQEIERQARELEDLLNVAAERKDRRTTAPPATPPRAPAPTPRPAPPSAPPSSPPSRSSRPEIPREAQDMNDKAMVMIRAMIHATKADGRVTRDEQQKIMEQIGDDSPETRELLRREFAEPFDVKAFVWSVPSGMEQQVYMVSLAAIDLDTQQEAEYLQELAHGLRLSPELVDQLHDRMGAPRI